MRDMGSQALRSVSNNKRYLILTYTGEFDRYPSFPPSIPLYYVNLIIKDPFNVLTLTEELPLYTGFITPYLCCMKLIPNQKH